MSAEVKILPMYQIIIDSFSKTFSNWKMFLKFLLLPYLGSVLGVLIAIIPPIFALSLSIGIKSSSLSAGAVIITLLSIVIGSVIFLWSFWIYIVRVAACFNIARSLINTGESGSLEEAVQNITERWGNLLKFWLWSLLIGIVIFVIILTVTLLLFGVEVAQNSFKYYMREWVYQILNFLLGLPFILSFAAFVFNPDLKPFDAIVKGVRMVMKNFLPTLGFWLLSYASALAVIFTAYVVFIIAMLLLSAPLFIVLAVKANIVLIIAAGIIAALGNFVVFFALLAFILMTAVLYTFFLTHWYMRLEAKNTEQLQ